MDEFIGKKYKLKNSENFEEYLIFIGVGLVPRKLVLSVSPVSILCKNDDGFYELHTNTPLKSTVTTFKLGEEFTEARADGKNVHSIMLWEGNKLIQTQTEKCGRKSTHIREYTGNSLTITTTAEGWDMICKREYELIQ